MCPKKQKLRYKQRRELYRMRLAKCFSPMNRKSIDLFAEHPGRIPSTSSFCPRNCRFQRWSFTSFVPIFGRPHCSGRIPIKMGSELIISKFLIINVIRTLPSENDFIPKFSGKKALTPVKLPRSFVPTFMIKRNDHELF